MIWSHHEHLPVASPSADAGLRTGADAGTIPDPAAAGYSGYFMMF